MRKDKKSFFEKLTGAINMDDEEYDFDEDFVEEDYSRPERRSFSQERSVTPPSLREEIRTFARDEFSEGQLSVDVLQTPDDIIIKTIVAGVSPEDLDVSISRDSVTIKGNRIDDVMVSDNDYIHREVAWGSFSRTISLPAEVEVEEADASEQHGILTIKLPKIDKERQTKLQVKRAQ
jgi:HSP20 family protein